MNGVILSRCCGAKMTYSLDSKLYNKACYEDCETFEYIIEDELEDDEYLDELNAETFDDERS